jgi:Flp pilus assembly protein TadD
MSIKFNNHASVTTPSYFKRGAALRKRLGDFDGAMKDLDVAITLEPSNGSLWMDRAHLFWELKDFKQMRDCC